MCVTKNCKKNEVIREITKAQEHRVQNNYPVTMSGREAIVIRHKSLDEPSLSITAIGTGNTLRIAKIECKHSDNHLFTTVHFSTNKP